MTDPVLQTPWSGFESLRFDQAAERLAGVALRTPIVELPSPDPRVALFGKLENRQVTGAFKARGAWNNVVQLSDEDRAAGVVCASSGNHGRALAWAARKAGVPATIVMPKDAYPNKIEACRAEEAEVVLAETRSSANDLCAERVAAGQVLIHPYDLDGTIEGAGTVGLEIHDQMPDVEAVLIPVGGGGLTAGCSLALRRAKGHDLKVVAIEPEGAATLTRGLAASEPVICDPITTEIQGLCPPSAGRRNIEICGVTVDDVWTVRDDQVYAAQKVLVDMGEIVEPAGAATYAAAVAGLADAWVARRSAANPLRVVVIVSGGNPHPDQLRLLREGA